MKLSKIWIAIFISWCWWVYLAFASQMLVSGDAIGYHVFGEMLNTHGWGMYFTTGPNREPGYLLLVAAALRLQQWTGMDYITILKVAQLLLLGCTQLLVWRWLSLLKASQTGIMIAVLCIGFSPAFINAALSMYSEILIMPIFVSLILAHVYWWQSLNAGTNNKSLAFSAWIALLWLACISVKAICWYVFLLYWPILAVVLLWKLSKDRRIAGILAWILALGIVVVSIQGYLGLQYKYNGSRMLTNRGSYLLYANAVRRTAALDSQTALAGILAVSGEGLCSALMPAQKCWYWGIHNQDVIGFAPLAQWSDPKISSGDKDKKYTQMAVEHIKTNVPQYAVFTFLEGLKMFFWESTQVSFVRYPQWVQGIYSNGPIKMLWRFIPALLTIWAFLILIYDAWLKRRSSFDVYISILTFFMIFVLLSAAYGLATVVIRYAFMIAPVWVGIWVIALERRRIFT